MEVSKLKSADFSPLVSVCMITYNHEAFINQSIEGVLIQETDFDIELIIADDASPDQTEGIVEGYINNYSNRLLINYTKHSQNIGVINNFIWALKQCKGKYIALCEGDDYWTDPYKLQKQVDFLEKDENFSLCFHNARLLINNEFSESFTNVYKTEFTLQDLFEKHFIATGSIVYRNNIDLPPYSKNVASGDKLLLLTCALKGKFKFLNEIMSVYRIHDEGISKTEAHVGIGKVYNMAKLLVYFDNYTQGNYTEYCKKSLQHEIATHILGNSTKNRKLSFVSTTLLIRELFRRIIRKASKFISK